MLLALYHRHYGNPSWWLCMDSIPCCQLYADGIMGTPIVNYVLTATPAVGYTLMALREPLMSAIY